MKILHYLIALLIISIMIQGCSAPYFGHTKEEWDNLSEKEKTVVKKEYQAVLDTRDKQAHADKINARTESIIDYGSGQSTL